MEELQRHYGKLLHVCQATSPIVKMLYNHDTFIKLQKMTLESYC